MKPNYDIQYIVIDLFCGAGGTSLAFDKVRIGRKKAFKIIACVNHDLNAIKSHKLNFKGIKHLTEDVRLVSVEYLEELVAQARLKYPIAKLILWASLECTNFSNAKGGLPKDADSRTLPQALIQKYDPSTNSFYKGKSYIQILNPDLIMIENVREFMAWGPLDAKGKPLSRIKGKDWLAWCNEIDKLGYHNDWKIMNSADYGAVQARKRLFGIFARKGEAISFPLATHEKSPKASMFGKLKKHRAVKEVLDLDNIGLSIFREKGTPCENTLKRILAGLVKFIANGDQAFIQMYYSGEGQVKSLDRPAGSVTVVDHHSLVNVVPFMLKYNSMGRDGRYNAPSIDDPCHTIATQDRIGIANAVMIDNYYGNGFASDINRPSPTVTTADNKAAVFISGDYGNGANVSSVENPSPTILPSPKQNLIHHFFFNPQYGDKGRSIERPCFTLIASMDKQPPSLISAKCGVFDIALYQDDCETMKQIKYFMAFYNITDITKRMLTEVELLQIQGFPAHYKLVGTVEERKKYIGNAVEFHNVNAIAAHLVRNVETSPVLTSNAA